MRQIIGMLLLFLGLGFVFANAVVTTRSFRVVRSAYQNDDWDIVKISTKIILINNIIYICLTILVITSAFVLL